MRVKPSAPAIILFAAAAAMLNARVGNGQPIPDYERTADRWTLTRESAPAILGIPEDQIVELCRDKQALTKDRFFQFARRFGRLQNGMPTYQVGPEVYFVLLSLSDLDRQPRGRDLDFANDRGKTPQAKLPAKVDHRPKQLPVHDQGRRGCCVAFAACAELESLPVPAGLGGPFSPNLAYFWFMQEENSTPCKDPGLPTFRAAEYLKRHAVCEEDRWPYVSEDPVSLEKRGACRKINIPPPGVNGARGVRISDYLLLPAGTETKPDGSMDIKDTLTLERLLFDGHDVVFGVNIAWEDETAKVIDVTLGPAGQPLYGSGGHAMLIVGYDRTASPPYFIVKNSWGKTYGPHDGYLYLSYDYIRTYAKYGYTTKAVVNQRVDIPPALDKDRP